MSDGDRTFGPEENEIMRAAREARDRKRAAARTPQHEGLSTLEKAAIGAGVGSAALAAALLFATKGKPKA